MQSDSSGADGHADSKPNGNAAPSTKWIIIKSWASTHYKQLFSKMLNRNYLEFKYRLTRTEAVTHMHNI